MLRMMRVLIQFIDIISLLSELDVTLQFTLCFYMPLYITLQHLLNVLVQIANKVGNKKKSCVCAGVRKQGVALLVGPN
jgi:hypothetical protein